MGNGCLDPKACSITDIAGIPCKHACSVFRKTTERPESYVDQCYHKSTQVKIYSHFITPVPGPNQWTKAATNLTVRPPIYKRPVGRPAKNRKRGPDSPVRNGRVTRGGTYIRCGECNQEGHNSRTCKAKPPTTNPAKKKKTVSDIAT